MSSSLQHHLDVYCSFLRSSQDKSMEISLATVHWGRETSSTLKILVTKLEWMLIAGT